MKYTTSNHYTIELTRKSFQHLEAHPDVLLHLPEAIQRSKPTDKLFQEIEIDMERPIGQADLIKLKEGEPSEKMIFARRKGRKGPSRVSMTEKTEVSNKIVLIIKKINPDTFILITAWIGVLAKKEPWDPGIKSEAERTECLRFWCSRALAYDPMVMEQPFESTWDEVLKNSTPLETESATLTRSVQKRYTEESEIAPGYKREISS